MTVSDRISPAPASILSLPVRPQPLSRLAVAFIVALAVAIQVQVTVPFTVAGLKLNAGDPLVAGLAGLLVLSLLRSGHGRVAWVWRMPGVWFWLAVLTSVLSLSLLVGYLRMQQLSMWAVANKYVGWFVLLGYFTSGAYVSAVFGTAGQRLFLRTFVVFAVLVAAASSLLLLLADFHVHAWLPKGDPVARGLMGNSNAFAFLLLAALAALYACQRGAVPLFNRRGAVVLMVLLWTGLWYCGSRTAWGAAIGLTLVAAWLGSLPWKEFSAAVCVFALATLVVMQSMPAAQSGDRNTTTTAKLSSLHIPQKLANDPSNIERFRGYRDAYALWRGDMLLGIGLGGFLHDQQSRYEEPQVIHNTALWILTEMGVLGALAFAAFAWKLVSSLRPFFSREFDRDHAIRMVGILLLAVFGAMSLLHELLFQRILWVMLGLVLCLPGQTADAESTGPKLW